MATAFQDLDPPPVAVAPPAPVAQIDSGALRQLGQDLDKLFRQYASDRRLTELKWLRNLRQYKGIYDPELEQQLKKGSSRAYPRITRAKCISVLSRIMNLMFPGNERNWSIEASPSPEMDPDKIAKAVQDLAEERQAAGLSVTFDEEMIEDAVKRYACECAEELSEIIDDQLQELGGDQTSDYVILNRKVADSGIKYGIGYLVGPFVREVQTTSWGMAQNGQFVPTTRTVYKPQFAFRPVWDIYTDMAARSPAEGDGWFERLVMTKSQLRKLANRPDFFADQIKNYLKRDVQGNFKEREFESELRTMGVSAHVNVAKSDPQGKYEVIVWHGPITARKLKDVGVDVPDANMADDVDAEVWLVGGEVIKAAINTWTSLGIENMRTLHYFAFDEDDTSPIPEGLPYVIRDSQMSVAAATRMTLDNASVTCGPNLEVNRSLLDVAQDITSIEPWKIWYRDDDTPATAAFPAVRTVTIDGHLAELKMLIELFMQFADMESFVGPATGGDMSQAPSEPMRTAAGASMLRGDAALPFKDIIRNFDSFTQSVILSLVSFNEKFNPDLVHKGDYNVIARGATSLIAKEVRGMQIDMLSQTLTPDERDHVDDRKFVEQKFAVRDMRSLMVPEDVAKQRKQQREAAIGEQTELQKKQIEAEVRKTLAEALKNITQSQKNSAAADAQTTNAALSILEKGLMINDDGNDNSGKTSGAA